MNFTGISAAVRHIEADLKNIADKFKVIPGKPDRTKIELDAVIALCMSLTNRTCGKYHNLNLMMDKVTETTQYETIHTLELKLNEILAIAQK